MTRLAPRRLILTLAACGSLAAALLPQAHAGAAGPIWLPTVQATHAAFSQQAPALATFRNHAYILITRSNPSSGATLGVYVTTNESGAWTTSLLSAHGPTQLLQEYETSLAVDPSPKRLYAAWVHEIAPGKEAVGVWTRPLGGAWSGPTDVAMSSQFSGPPSIVAGNGKAYVAFAASASGQCNDSKSLRSDVLVATFDGSAWSQPRNLTRLAHEPTP